MPDFATLLTSCVTILGGGALLVSNPGFEAAGPKAPAPLPMVGGSYTTHAAATSPAMTVLPTERGADGRLYLVGSVNGKAVRFLVDTGATRTVLSARDATAVGLTMSGKTTLRTAGGTTEAWSGVADSFEIAEIRLPSPGMLVVPQNETSLIGMDLLGKLGARTLAL